MSLREYFPYPTPETWVPGKNRKASPTVFKVYFGVMMVTGILLCLGSVLWLIDDPSGSADWITYISYIGLIIGFIGIVLSAWVLYNQVGYREYKIPTIRQGVLRPDERVVTAARKLDLEYQSLKE